MYLLPFHHSITVVCVVLEMDFLKRKQEREKMLKRVQDEKFYYYKMMKF